MRRVSALTLSIILMAANSLNAQVPSELEGSESSTWMEPIPVPADPELEAQIIEIQDALSAIHQQTVRRKDTLQRTEDPAAKAKLYSELEALRKEREDLEALLHDLVDEARASQRTAIDEALQRARAFERRQESWEKQEELTRDRQAQ